MYITENDKIVIRQLVEKQLQAFKKNDWDTAFSLTSPSIQNKLEPSSFITTIKQKYNAIVDPRSIMFQGFTLIDDYPALTSMIMDQNGQLTQGIFIVEYQHGFDWCICGYKLLSVDEKIIQSW